MKVTKALVEKDHGKVSTGGFMYSIQVMGARTPQKTKITSPKKLVVGKVISVKHTGTSWDLA